MNYDLAYSIVFNVALIVIALCILLVIIKSLIGPRISDRLVTINMICTLGTSCIAILSAYFVNQTYLIDVCIIYVLISFLSVCVFTSVYINEYLKKKKTKSDKEEK